MRRITDREQVEAALRRSGCAELLAEFADELFLLVYEAGEFPSSPLDDRGLFQVVVEGRVEIYCIRDDGTVQSVTASAGEEFILGDIELFRENPESIYAEAVSEVTCLALLVDPVRERLMSSNTFLRGIASSLAGKMAQMTAFEFSSDSLRERVLTYLRYKCPDGVLRGVEQGAFHLRCSARQLQRVLNQLRDEGEVERVGKGTWRLAERGERRE